MKESYILMSDTEIQDFVESNVDVYEDQEHIFDMLQAVQSCINGNPHGSFITSVANQDWDNARPDSINLRHFDVYKVFMNQITRKDQQ